MAGIGFELRRMIGQRDGFLAKVRAYACAGLISSGPWLMTILTLTLLNLAGPYLGGNTGYALFRALVTYAFAFSLIFTGIGQMAVTRRIADLLYGKEYDRVLPAFAATLLVTGLLHAVIALGFALWAGFSVTLTCLVVVLFAVIGMTWIALIWLSVARQYDEVLRAYIYGTLIAMIGVVLLVMFKGTAGILTAYTAGQAFTLVMLVRTIARGMESGGGRDFTVLTSITSFPRLVAVGLFYNAAIWIDKMIFWFRDGIAPHPIVRYHPLYDTCSFLAYMTVVPALAVNLVRLETSFYEHYRAYYGAILGGTPLEVIEDKRKRMLRNLEEGVVRLLRVQGAISILVILFAPFIIDFLELPPVGVRLFRLTCLGAFFHVMLLITILMQMYFDLRTQAMATSVVFFVLNGGLAWWSVSRGIETYGIGYALASFLSLLLGYTMLYRALERLDYMTFTNQPIGGDRKEVEEVPEEAEEKKEGKQERPAPALEGEPAPDEPASPDEGPEQQEPEEQEEEEQEEEHEGDPEGPGKIVIYPEPQDCPVPATDGEPDPPEPDYVPAFVDDEADTETEVEPDTDTAPDFGKRGS